MNLNIMCIFLLIISTFFSFNAFAHLYGAKVTINNDTEDDLEVVFFPAALRGAKFNFIHEDPSGNKSINLITTIARVRVPLKPNSKKIVYVDNVSSHEKITIRYAIYSKKLLVPKEPSPIVKDMSVYKSLEDYYEKQVHHYPPSTPPEQIIDDFNVFYSFSQVKKHLENQDFLEITDSNYSVDSRGSTSSADTPSNSGNFFYIKGSKVIDDIGQEHAYMYAYFDKRFPRLNYFKHTSEKMPLYYRVEATPDLYSANFDTAVGDFADLTLTVRYVCGLKLHQIYEGMKIPQFCY
ncbi:hypothetical protein [Spirobacillus cienkowskii]|uniref:DUF4138 domain-containing protein n=1 Tax=Spirobacillus cienkowskii TaxID=495820 RepID=A0A369KLG4_9BACT|nr:MAG: hypothetical protein DCC88_09915 [Spirobacillus cienkowskii]